MTTIGSSIVITGDVISDEDLTVEGRVKGMILVRDGTLTITERGQVHAEVRGARVHIDGDLKGSVTATERITLTATAAVKASLSANHVVIADGARFSGGIDMDRRTIVARLAQHRAVQTA
ncbi:MAG: polymer-forming cytoskeletal protein [Vicinamibacterales bacterium]